MHPILIKIGSFQLPTYGLLLALALLTAVITADRLGRREGFDGGRILDFSTWIIVVGLVGAKVLMIISDWGYYRQNPSEIVSWATLQAGGVFYGGFIASALFAVWYVRTYRLPALKMFDIYAPAVALAQSVGRWGCFSAGCDYGTPTRSFLGVVFTNQYSHEVTNVPLNTRIHPTQLYESLATLVIGGILLWRYRHKKRDGEIFLLYLSLYAVARFFLEFLRGDEDRGFVFHHLLSTSQFVAILALLASLGLWTYLRRQPKLAAATPPARMKERRYPAGEAGVQAEASTRSLGRATEAVRKG
ncbi:MAG TPA: prolipoprotein diacylglyceryl transferase [Terriglobia bacterium]|nr:prolipoprotein diacylglyceryl transferase [Terriglobia bacterium]